MHRSPISPAGSPAASIHIRGSPSVASPVPYPMGGPMVPMGSAGPIIHPAGPIMPVGFVNPPTEYPLVNDAPTYYGGANGQLTTGEPFYLKQRRRHHKKGVAIPDEIKVDHIRGKTIVQTIKIPTTYHLNPEELETTIVNLLNEKHGVQIREFGELEYKDIDGDWIAVNSSTNFWDDIVPATRLRWIEIEAGKK